MNKDLKHLLKASLKKERETVENKISNSIDNRFENAKILFNDQSDVKIKNKTDKVIKDSFTMPEHDYRLIEICKNKLLENKINATKSEIIRASLILLNTLSNGELVNCYNLIQKIKTGRPKNK